jgi:Trk K+ transport system NAD-binding subunit
MANALLVFWRLMFGGTSKQVRRVRWRVPVESAVQASATVFLVLRRMRSPLIALIVIFAISTLGLTLIPGVDSDGNPHRIGFFHAFYVMSYTATTIGFGEIPHAFTDAQRLWVMVSIYLAVIGWAYAIGSLLTLLQDRAFRRALALQHFTRKVARMREPFLLLVGYGQTGRLLGRAFDSMSRRFVVIDGSDESIDALDLEAYRFDVPGLAADARNPDHLGIAGLGHASCEAVLAMTNDDEVNLAVSMAAALLRPDLPVIARTVSPAIAHRMHAFGTPTVVNPFDRFGDHLRLALRAPATHQLMTWLESGPGAELPKRGRPPTQGRWVLCGYGRFGRELAEDLQAEGLTVTVVDPLATPNGNDSVVVGDGSDPEVMGLAELDSAVGFVAGTDNDTTNLSLVAAARRINPGLFVAARQNRPANAALFHAMQPDSLLVLAEVVAHEVYAKLSTPMLWRFLQEVPAQGDEWAAGVIERLHGRCGRKLQTLWRVRISAADSPALRRWLTNGRARLGDLLRHPDDRDRPLAAVALLLLRADACELTPPDDYLLADGDQILLAGEPEANRALDTTLLVEGTLDYVVTGRHVPSSWIWRRLTRRTAPEL